MSKEMIAVAMSGLLVWMNTSVIRADAGASLSELVNRSYLELLEEVAETSFSDKDLNGFREYLKQRRKREEQLLKQEEKGLKAEIEEFRFSRRFRHRKKSEYPKFL